jgi:hypothetical protein
MIVVDSYMGNYPHLPAQLSAHSPFATARIHLKGTLGCYIGLQTTAASQVDLQYRDQPTIAAEPSASCVYADPTHVAFDSVPTSCSKMVLIRHMRMGTSCVLCPP